MTKPAFYLTRQAARTLRDIYARSEEIWGQSRAESYIAEIYAAMNNAAMGPDVGKLRQARSAPFFMNPARKHFIVYDRFAKGVVILTLLHQRRDIETLIAEMETSFFAEIEAIKKEL